MTAVALFGAGGKMGLRIGRNLVASRFSVLPVEVSEAGRARFAEAHGIACVGAEDAIAKAQVIVLAVPDTVIGAVTQGLVPKLRPGTMVIILDAAAPHAAICPSAPTSPISSPIRAIRRSSTTRRIRPRAPTISAASPRSSISSVP